MKINILECLKRVEQITGTKITSYTVDCLDLELLRDIFRKHSIYAILNFAALKSVGESVQKPVLYYKNNVGCLLNLLTVIFLFLFNSYQFHYINLTFIVYGGI